MIRRWPDMLHGWGGGRQQILKLCWPEGGGRGREELKKTIRTKRRKWLTRCPSWLFYASVNQHWNLLYCFRNSTSRVWSYCKNFIRCKRQETSKAVRFEVIHVAWLEPQRNCGGQGFWATANPPIRTYHCWDKQSQFFIYSAFHE